jgi:hypothetical protein
MSINKIQQLQFELIKNASFNSFDGEQVVNDLINHRDLWHGVIMGRDDLIHLRDIEAGLWRVDTLHILSTGKDDNKLKSLAKEWNADTYDFESDEKASRLLGTSKPKGRVLSIWWD